MAKPSTIRQERAVKEEASAPVRTPAAQTVSANLDRLIHERIRLGIVSALAVNRSQTFNELKARATGKIFCVVTLHCKVHYIT
jgi:hypothetical protein